MRITSNELHAFARFSTDDRAGTIRGYVGEGEFTSDALNTFGGVGVVRIPELQSLLHYICENGFEHHVAANLSTNRHDGSEMQVLRQPPLLDRRAQVAALCAELGSTIICVAVYYGYNVTGGAVGIGKAVAKTMAVALVLTVVVNALLTQVFWGVNPNLPIQI